ncbi:MAG: MgtC/SapB family protein [Stellaceae bacterium]|jgi:putative Mg2+ transporter-C (MgtC) family protein
MLAHWELVVRLLIAAGLGSLIGAERERLVWAAGLRTHMLVSVGSCLFMIVSAYGFSTVIAPGVILDPSRVAAQVVSGIGFLGAGSILLRGDVVRGLTTAASLWTVAAIGLAVGGGLYTEAVAATLIILIILAGIKPLEEWYQRRNTTHKIRLIVDGGKMSTDILNNALGYRARRVIRYVSVPSADPLFEDVTITVQRLSAADIIDILHQLEALPNVREVAEI